MSENTRDWKLSLIVGFGYYLIRTLASTWRIRPVNSDAYTTLSARQQPFIFAFWHGQLLPLLYVHRGQSVAVLVSSHRDGEIVARIAERLEKVLKPILPKLAN